MPAECRQAEKRMLPGSARKTPQQGQRNQLELEKGKKTFVITLPLMVWFTKQGVWHGTFTLLFFRMLRGSFQKFPPKSFQTFLSDAEAFHFQASWKLFSRRELPGVFLLDSHRLRRQKICLFDLYLVTSKSAHGGGSGLAIYARRRTPPRVARHFFVPFLSLLVEPGLHGWNF